jgi:hypothetical protein
MSRPTMRLLPGAPRMNCANGRACSTTSKKLSDPSHVRCLGLVEWKTLVSGAGFTVTHDECLDKEIEFDAWVRRMRSYEATSTRFKEMLLAEPLRGFLRTRDAGSGPDFTLKEGIILAHKPR